MFVWLYLTSGLFILGAFLNAIFLWLYCQANNWQKTSNIKFLVVLQALSSIIVIACSLALNFENFLPRSYACFLPSILVFVLSFAWINFAFLLVVQHAQLTSIWRLRFKTALLIIFTELVVCTAIEFPILYSSIFGPPIVLYELYEDGALRRCNTQTTQVSWGIKFNVVLYGFWYIFLHFGIVGSLIVNRILAIAMHLWFKESDDDQKPQQRCYITAQHWMNALSIVLVNVFIIVLFVRLENNEETLNFLNKIFHAMVTNSRTILIFALIPGPGLPGFEN